MTENLSIKLEKKPDGTWDATCDKCHMSVGSAASEASLSAELANKKHTCYDWNSESRIRFRSNI